FDAYIAKSADFAKPILTHLREAVHAACPEAEEAMKWSHPTFMYKGKLLASMAAFKQHATFGFWRGKEVVGSDVEMGAMGQFGRLTWRGELPKNDVLAELIRKAMTVTASGPAPREPKHEPRQKHEMPAELASALSGNAAAATTFQGFPPSAQ